MQDLEINIHSAGTLSIKDLTSDINLADNKWDSIITFLVTQTNYVFFEGHRSLDFDKLLESSIKENAKEIIDERLNKSSVTIELHQNRLLWGRKSINKLWSYFEFPALLFWKYAITVKEVERRLEQYQSYNNLVKALHGTYIIHRGIEQNVLWFNKSTDLEFPIFKTNP